MNSPDRQRTTASALDPRRRWVGYAGLASVTAGDRRVRAQRVGPFIASSAVSEQCDNEFGLWLSMKYNGPMQTLYEAAGGRDGLLRLAGAWHTRVLEDDVVSHAFSHG